MKHGKKYTDSAKLIESLKQYDPDRGCRPGAADQPRPNLTRPWRLSVRLGVDPRHADQQVRGAVVSAPRHGPYQSACW